MYIYIKEIVSRKLTDLRYYTGSILLCLFALKESCI